MEELFFFHSQPLTTSNRFWRILRKSLQGLMAPHIRSPFTSLHGRLSPFNCHKYDAVTRSCCHWSLVYRRLASLTIFERPWVVVAHGTTSIRPSQACQFEWLQRAYRMHVGTTIASVVVLHGSWFMIHDWPLCASQFSILDSRVPQWSRRKSEACSSRMNRIEWISHFLLLLERTAGLESQRRSHTLYNNVLLVQVVLSMPNAKWLH